MQGLKISPQGTAHWHRETLNNTSGEPVLVPFGITRLTVALIVLSGSGQVDYTTSPPDAVEDGSAAWRVWPHGSVSATVDDVLNAPVTAVRGVSVGGSLVFEALGA